VYDIASVVANCEAAFGLAPVVAPESTLMRTLLEGLIDARLLSAEDWNGTVPPSPGEPRRSDPSRRPVIGPHARDHSEFLEELDFWVYFHGPDLYESFDMAAVEAMAAGLVVILPAAMEANFGDGALYGDPADVAPMIDRLWADPEAYAAQSARAVRTARERFGEAALLARVERYLG
jgi:hypothetical protein